MGGRTRRGLWRGGGGANTDPSQAAAEVFQARGEGRRRREVLRIEGRVGGGGGGGGGGCGGGGGGGGGCGGGYGGKVGS